MEKLFGINTVKISSAEGIGFAVPINVVKPVIDSFINNNSFEQATMGVYAYDKEVIPYLNSNLSFSKGIYVSQIIKNGPAANTDLKEGDIIVSIDGKELNTMNDLREYIYSKKANEDVSLQVSRGKINKSISITLRKKIGGMLEVRGQKSEVGGQMSTMVSNYRGWSSITFLVIPSIAGSISKP